MLDDVSGDSNRNDIAKSSGTDGRNNYEKWQVSSALDNEGFLVIFRARLLDYRVHRGRFPSQMSRRGQGARPMQG